MAIIYSYPDKSSPSLSDKIIITDVESTPANQTKRCTIQGLADAISGQFTLQEVLQAGSSAIGKTGNTWSGNMSLKEDGPFILPRIGRQWTVDMNSLTGSANDKVAYLVGDMQIAGDGDTKTGDLDMSGNLTVATNGNIAGNLNMTGLTGDVILNGGNFTATAGKQTKFQASTGVGAGFTFDTNGNATAGFTAGTVVNKLANVDFQVEGFFTVNSANSTTGDVSIYAGDDMILRGSDITIQATAGSGHILDLGNYSSSSNRFDETNISAEDIIRLRTYSGTARMELSGATGSVNYFSALDLQTNELRLNGSAGSSGQVLVSGGGGTNPTWSNATDTITWPTNAALVGDASNAAVSTAGQVDIDTVNNQTTLTFGARYNTDAGSGTGLGTTNANIQFGREAMAQVYGAGTHTTSGLNLAVGNEALMGNVGVGAVCSGNTAIGWQAMKNQDMANTFLNNNVAIGPGALRGAALSAAGLGGDNVAIGALAMDSTTATTARRNVAIGSNALTNQTVAESNTAMGYNVGGSVVTGQDNVLIGSASDLTADHSGSTGVGRNVRVAEGALALGHNANANISGSIALGAGAVANNPTINLTVNGAPAPAGGLPQHPDNAAALAAGLNDGDVYVIPVPAATPGFGGGAYVMAIVHP